MNKEGDYLFVEIPLATLPVQQHAANQSLCCVWNWTPEKTHCLEEVAMVSLNQLLAKRKKILFQKLLFSTVFSEHPIVKIHTLEQGKSNFLSKILFSVLIFTIITQGFLNISL